MTKSPYASFLFLGLSLTFGTPSHAGISHGQSSDLFYDRQWVYDRPPVPSDYQRSSDMLPRVPLMFNQDADLFDYANKTNTFGGNDMLPRLPVPYQRPHYILTMDPPQGPYDVR